MKLLKKYNTADLLFYGRLTLFIALIISTVTVYILHNTLHII